MKYDAALANKVGVYVYAKYSCVYIDKHYDRVKRAVSTATRI